jgi:hypothetical protein
MIELHIGDQLVRFDRDATVSAYSQIPQGEADSCPCSGCRNFRLLRSTAYPDTFRALLSTLGIDPNKECEAVHYGPRAGHHFYGGWFHFVGQLVETGERLVQLDNEFRYFARRSFGRPPAAFGQTVAAVEFTTLLPWVLKEPYDPTADAQILKAEEIMKRYPNALQALANSDQ